MSIDFAALTERLIRLGSPHRTTRASGVSAVERWLFQHPDGGWLQSGEAVREATAKRLLFLLWLMSEGRCSEDGPTEDMIRRAVAIPRERSRGLSDE